MHTTFRALLRPLALTAHCLCALAFLILAAPMCAAATGVGPTITMASIAPATLPVTGGVITVAATVTDAANSITSVKATVTLTGNADFGGYQSRSQTITLSNGGTGSAYTGNVSSAGTNTTTSSFIYTATITATDDSPLSTTATATGQTVQATDTTPPVIAGAVITPTILPSSGGVITVSATVTDPAGRAITGVTAIVTLTGNADFGGYQSRSQTITLSNGSGNVYTGNVSSVGANATTAPFTYTATLRATNDLGLTNTATAAGQTAQADSSGAVPQTSHTHILWKNTDGTVSLWTVGSDHSYTYKNYGPYPGWTASAVSDGPDGISHILWTHTADGQISLWDLSSTGFLFNNYGPFAGWTASGMSSGL